MNHPVIRELTCPTQKFKETILINISIIALYLLGLNLHEMCYMYCLDLDINLDSDMNKVPHIPCARKEWDQALKMPPLKIISHFRQPQSILAYVPASGWVVR